MSQRISFPVVNAPLIPATPQVSTNPKTTLIIGQMLSPGTATAATLIQNVAVGQENALFGTGSQLASTILEFRKINPISRVDAIALADNGTTKAAATVVIAGTAVAGGTITVTINGYAYNYTTVTGDTPTIVAAALAALIVANTGAKETATSSTGTLTITAKNAGTVANKYCIGVSNLNTGLTYTLTGFAGGATDPIVTTIPALINERCDILMPYEYGVTPFVAVEEAVFNKSNYAYDGRVFTATTDTSANLITLANALNYKTLVIFGDNKISNTSYVGSAIPASPMAKVAQFVAARALRFEDNADISSIVVATAPEDSIGGVHTASLPYFNTPLQLPIIPNGYGFVDLESTNLTAAGISLMGDNDPQNQVIVGQVVTTYKTNAQGLNDVTYKNLEYVDTATAAREYIINNLKADYGQHRLTGGQGVAGYSFASKGSLMASMVEYYQTLSGDGYVLLQQGTLASGTPIIKLFKNNLVVTLNVATGTVTINGILPIVTQLRQIICPLNIVFNLKG